MHSFVRASVILSLFLAPSLARADVKDVDDVTLKDGGEIRGTVISVEPGKEVKMTEMGSTSVRVIPWSQVADVQKGKYAEKTKVDPGAAGPGYAGPPTLPEPPPRPRSRDVEGRKVKLHVESPEPTTVMHVESQSLYVVGNTAIASTMGSTACEAPCDEELSAASADRYFAKGDYPDPGTFSLASIPEGDEATLKIKPGSFGRRIGGWLAISTGGAAAVGGGTAFIFSDQLEDPAAVGGSLIGLGLATVVGGIVLVATSGTHMSLESETPAPGESAAMPHAWVGTTKEAASSAPGSKSERAVGASAVLGSTVAGLGWDF